MLDATGWMVVICCTDTCTYFDLPEISRYERMNAPTYRVPIYRPEITDQRLVATDQRPARTIQPNRTEPNRVDRL